MNWLDIVLIVVIGIATFIGLRKGIIKMSLTLAGLIGGIVVAGRYYVPFSQYLTCISSTIWARIAAFSIIFIGIMVIAALLAKLLEKAASAIMLGWTNRLVGAILGFVMGSLFCGAVLAVWIKYLGTPGTVTESQIAPLLLNVFPRVLTLLPEDFETVRSFFQ
ncbi:MAG: CvpA family protein [Dehalococcoidales bacterium]